MHINSCAGPACSANWCYCCGRHRRRNHPEDCRGCDANRIFIEHQPGWDRYARMGKRVAGIAALNEFHRRRIRYFVHLIKEETSPELWQQFRQSHPDILTGVPADGLVIEWDELNHPEASRPPVFGNSTEEDLMWKLPPGIQNPQKPAPSHRPIHNIQVPPPSLRPWNEVFYSRGGVLWICCALLTVSLLLLQWFKIDHYALKLATGIFFSTNLYGAISFYLLRVADYNEVQIANNTRNDMYRGEVQFVGSNLEPPYLSKGGRWSQYRRRYVIVFIGGLAYGSYSIAASSST
jgi:hypothetical protein